MHTKRKYTEGTEHGIDFDARYRVTTMPGVAFYLNGWQQVWENGTYFTIDADGVEYMEDDADEGEWIDDPDHRMVRAVMVGDDTEHIVDRDDLVVIADDDYCSECGQIGCTADGR
jgi:hypothetical protein